MTTLSIRQAHDGQAQADFGGQPATHSAAALKQLSLGALMRRCTAESERFRRGQPSNTSYAYELFRRALVESDNDAWAYLYELYHSLVEHWVCKNSAFEISGETSEALASEAFARFWQAIPPARFANFPSTAALLQYLQLCTSCVVIDSVRAANRLAAAALAPLGETHQRPPEQEVLERLRREELWRYIGQRLNSEAERVVIGDSFVYGLKPSAIQARRPDLFASVNDVYAIKRNLIERLSRDQRLRALLA